MRNEIEKIVKNMLKESMNNDALKSFAKQLRIVLGEGGSGRTKAKNDIEEHLESALEKYYQVILMNKKTFLTRENKSGTTKWKNALNGILKKLETANTNKKTRKKRYWSMGDIEKWITSDTRQDGYEFAELKLKKDLDFVPSEKASRATLEKMYNLVGRKIPNWE